MRLTLRTLLAYLDNTLEPQDAQILKAKLGDSGFATQLVQRIRAGLVNPELATAAPDAVAPNDDANLVGEYLDSTLSVEQVAEIERACLESDSRLAEAAACHQILTMVLGNKADVSPELRSRIYELPEREIERIAAKSNRFSSLAIDDGPPVESDLTRFSDAPPTAASPLTHTGGPVTPVGVGDSGVFDAPTRLRESGVIDAGDVGAGPDSAIAGSKPRDKKDTAIYGGSIRTSRITPWLVSLALAGVLLFALTQIFAPLMGRKTAMVDPDSSANIETNEPEIEVPADQSPPMVSIENDSSIDDSDAEMLPAPLPTPDVANDLIETDEMAPPMPSPDQPVLDEMAAAELPVSELPDAELPGGDLPSADLPSAELPSAESAEDADDFQDMAPPMPTGVASADTNRTETDEPAAAEDLVDPAGAAEAKTPSNTPSNAPEIATITTEATLVMADMGFGSGKPNWVRLKKGMTVVPGFPIVCPPTFRTTMTSVTGFDITLVGPVEAIWLVQEGEAVLAIQSGRVLVKSNKPGNRLDLALGNELVSMVFPDVATVAAASIKHFRAPGFDPRLAENRIELAGVLSVQGSIELVSDVGPEKLITGQQWVKRGPGAPKVSAVDSVPEWTSAPDPIVEPLQAGAREGLLELVGSDQPLEISLREATLFRRSEVASLAAQTLLHMGQGDIYFGSDGILSETKQRAYWPEHFLELLATVDRSAESAQQLEASIVKMEAANAEAIFRLLIGYSQKQLIEGGDETLVDMLNSESMAVRVLALENLHKITGTTLYFRAEQDNAVRRAPGIKKWVVRQRKGDIRWPE